MFFKKQKRSNSSWIISGFSVLFVATALMQSEGIAQNIANTRATTEKKPNAPEVYVLEYTKLKSHIATRAAYYSLKFSQNDLGKQIKSRL